MSVSNITYIKLMDFMFPVADFMSKVDTLAKEKFPLELLLNILWYTGPHLNIRVKLSYARL